MDGFIISNNKSKTAQIAAIALGAFLTISWGYLTISEALANRYGFLFFASLINFISGAILILQNTLFRAKPLLEIDSNTIKADMPLQKKISIEWVNVSEVSLGISYVVFLINGQKQQKIDLSTLVYNDLRNTKSKIIELCEHKNIPYRND